MTMEDDPRDAWLQHALRHAPDADAVPPPALREAILQKARGVVAPSGGLRARFAALAAWLARPPVAAALASVMFAVVIGGLWRGAFEEERADALPQPASQDARGTANVAAPPARQPTPSAADAVAQKARPSQAQPQPPRAQPQPPQAQPQPRRRDAAEAPAAPAAPAAPKAERTVPAQVEEARREAAAPAAAKSALGATGPARDPLAPIAAVLEARGPALHWTWRSRSRAHDLATRAWFDAARSATAGRWQRASDAEPEGAPLQLLDGTRVQAEFRLNDQRLLLLHPTLGVWQAPLAEADAARLRALADGW
jgi:outer membrane biosynthesis protein TonB